MDIPLRKILSVLYPGGSPARKQNSNGALSGIRNGKWALLILLSVLILIHLAALLYYNGFLSLQYDVEEARAQIDTQLQRRKNIILSMNVMVIDYAKHEKEIFTHAADTRKEMLEPASETSSEGALKMPGDLDALLSKIFAIAERYPDLRLSENFQRFMDALVDVESKVAEERMVYNQRANAMSTALGKFPGFLFARLYGFEAPAFFESEPGAQKPPKVE